MTHGGVPGDSPGAAQMGDGTRQARRPRRNTQRPIDSAGHLDTVQGSSSEPTLVCMRSLRHSTPRSTSAASNAGSVMLFRARNNRRSQAAAPLDNALRHWTHRPRSIPRSRLATGGQRLEDPHRLHVRLDGVRRPVSCVQSQLEGHRHGADPGHGRRGGAGGRRPLL